MVGALHRAPNFFPNKVPGQASKNRSLQGLAVASYSSFDNPTYANGTLNAYNSYMEIQITPNWTIELDDDFYRRLEAEHLVLWKRGITLLTAVYRYTGEKERLALVAKLRAKAEALQAETIDEHEGELYRFGYLQPEQVQAGHTRLALHAFTTMPLSCLHTSFYFDEPKELQKALIAWKSVRWHADLEEV